MTDTATQKSLRVRNEGTAGPYILLPLSQLDEVHQLLEKHKIAHLVEENAISINGGPADIVINLGRRADISAIQTILDRAE